MKYIKAALLAVRLYSSKVGNWVLSHRIHALAIVLALACAFMFWNMNSTNTKLTTANTTISTQKAYIQDQSKILDQHIVALIKEKKTLADTIKSNNDAVSKLQKAGDDALANANKAKEKVQVIASKYSDLANRYAHGNSTEGTAEQRIKAEQDTTDQFITDYGKVK